MIVRRYTYNTLYLYNFEKYRCSFEHMCVFMDSFTCNFCSCELLCYDWWIQHRNTLCVFGKKACIRKQHLEHLSWLLHRFYPVCSKCFFPNVLSVVFCSNCIFPECSKCRVFWYVLSVNLFFFGKTYVLSDCLALYIYIDIVSMVSIRRFAKGLPFSRSDRFQLCDLDLRATW